MFLTVTLFRVSVQNGREQNPYIEMMSVNNLFAMPERDGG